MPLISITRVRVRSWIYLPAFAVQSLRSARQAARAPGNLGVRLLQDNRGVYWTCTGWSSEGSMRDFMLAKPHGPVMRNLRQWCDEAAMVHWSQPEEELPSWVEAHRRVQQEGRASKVNHPSAAHTAHSIAPPIVLARRELRFK